MAEIELRERFFGDGLVGDVRFPASDFAPLRQAFVEAAERTAREVAGVRDELAGIGWTLSALSSAVWSLEQQLTVRLDTQTEYLARQLDTLASIDAALRTPAKVRAAEKMADAAGLLRAHRYDRALRCAEDAIEADPNHPGGFVAAGWAHIGSGDASAASAAFVEAGLAAKSPLDRAEYARLAGRSLIVCGDPARARSVLEHALEPGLPHLVSGALHYDIALASSQVDDDITAADRVEAAVRCDRRFAQMTVAEPLFDGHPTIPARALRVARELADEERRVDEQLVASRARLREALAGLQRTLDAAEVTAQELGLADEWDELDDQYTVLLDADDDIRIRPDARNAQLIIVAELEKSVEALLEHADSWTKRLTALEHAVAACCVANRARINYARDWRVYVIRQRLLRDEWMVSVDQSGCVTVEKL